MRNDGSELPFPPAPSASIAGQTLQTSTMIAARTAEHLPADAPNVLIVLMDDLGFGLADTFGGPISTPTLTRVAADGHQLQRVSYDVDLLADARRALDRPQPPARRFGHDRRTRASISTAIPA